MVWGCKDRTPKTAQESSKNQSSAAGHTGIVVETINSAGYTYVQVDTGRKKIWVAAPEMHIKTGDRITVPMGTPMKDFHSETLDRTFDLVYFVSNIMMEDTKQTSDKNTHEFYGTPKKKTGSSTSTKVDFSEIEKPKGGKTVSELYAEKGNLSGKEVLVRGKVVKYNPKIMGKNWIHLQDGTGEEGSNDLTINSLAKAKVGDIIIVKGVLSTDKDYGFGYKYDIIIEDAKVTVE